MVADAERFKTEDERHRGAVEARDGLDGYVAHVRTVITDTKLSAKLTSEQRTRLTEVLNGVTAWLAAPKPSVPGATAPVPTATAAPAGTAAAAPAVVLLAKSEYEKKQRELEIVAAPLIDRVFGTKTAAAAAGSEDDKENTTPAARAAAVAGGISSPLKSGTNTNVTAVVASPAPAAMLKAGKLAVQQAVADADLD